MSEPNKFGQALQEWWDSDACKQLQKETEAAKQRAVGKYFMLSEEDKLDMVQAICHIMCKAESEGVSHRDLWTNWAYIQVDFGSVNLWMFIIVCGLFITIRSKKKNSRTILIPLITS